jgi:hypothetical protein
VSFLVFLIILSSVDIEDIRVGRSKVSLAFHRTRSSTGFSLLEQQSDVRVIMAT